MSLDHFVAAGHLVCAVGGMEIGLLFHAMIRVIRGEGDAREGNACGFDFGAVS